jgi:hypothetical protein
MNKKITILIAFGIISFLIMGASPGRVWTNNDPDGKPWPQEVNKGEPTMEKIYINWGDLQVGSPSSVSNNWSQSTTSGEVLYFVKNNNIYYWFDLPNSRLPKVGLCRWRYLYDTEHEW